MSTQVSYFNFRVFTEKVLFLIIIWDGLAVISINKTFNGLKVILKGHRQNRLELKVFLPS